MGYKLSEEYCVPAKRVVCQNQKVAERIDKVRRTLYRTDTRLPVHKHLRDWLSKLEVDGVRARAEVWSTPRLAEHADIHLTAIGMIESGHVEFSHCRNGRVHSLVTRLSREIRQHLRIKNQNLVNIDIMNSQPLILCLTLPPTTPPHPHPTPSPTTTTHHTTITLDISGDENTQIYDSNGLTLNSTFANRDIEKYRDLCDRGVIYDYLESLSGMQGMTRQQVKEMFYREVFFGRNQAVTDFTQLFASEFPTVMESIRDTKRKDYRELACLMQRRESDVMIHGVCRRLAKEHPDIPVITIHDSIMTTPGHVDCVSGIILDEFRKVGLNPKLKIERPVISKAA